jgi:hypothetical protein
VRSGTTATLRSVSAGSSLGSLGPPGASSVYAVGDDGTVLERAPNDWLSQWRAIGEEVGAGGLTLRSVSHSSNHDVVIVGDRGAVFTFLGSMLSSAGTPSWKAHSVAGAPSLRAACAAIGKVIVAGEGAAYGLALDITGRPYATLTLSSGDAHPNFTAMDAFVSSGHSWPQLAMVSAEGLAYRNAPSTAPTVLSSRAVTGGVGLNGLAVCEDPLGEATYIAVGSAGAIYRSTNGAEWQLEASGTTEDLFAVTCASDTLVGLCRGREGHHSQANHERLGPRGELRRRGPAGRQLPYEQLCADLLRRRCAGNDSRALDEVERHPSVRGIDKIRLAMAGVARPGWRRASRGPYGRFLKPVGAAQNRSVYEMTHQAPTGGKH